MQIICISRGSFGYGNELAEKLASKLGYECIARENLTDSATDEGIPVGKIEATILKRRPISEALAVQVELMKAFISARICERALEKEVVYHGRTGHLVLPGISHVLRIRAIANSEERINMTLRRMPSLSREKAKLYNDQVDEDRRRWVRTLYNVDWEDPSLYDITINSLNMTVDNSASALVSVAQLPDFRETPASSQALKDTFLAARCRLAIGKDERTRDVNVTVKADHGNVAVTYLPRQSKEAAAIPEVLEKISDIHSIVCTVATTNILYIQENFDSEAPSLDQVIQVAEKWNASIELIRLAERTGARPVSTAPPAKMETSNRATDGGILDDTPAISPEEDSEGVAKTFDRLPGTDFQPEPRGKKQPGCRWRSFPFPGGFGAEADETRPHQFSLRPSEGSHHKHRRSQEPLPFRSETVASHGCLCRRHRVYLSGGFHEPGTNPGIFNEARNRTPGAGRGYRRPFCPCSGLDLRKFYPLCVEAYKTGVDEKRPI